MDMEIVRERGGIWREMGMEGIIETRGESGNGGKEGRNLRRNWPYGVRN